MPHRADDPDPSGLRVTDNSARTPGSITPTRARRTRSATVSRAAAVAVLQATTTSLTSWSSTSLGVICAAKPRTSSGPRPVWIAAGVAYVDDVLEGRRSIRALATVSPPKPLSNIPMGRSSMSRRAYVTSPTPPGTRARPGMVARPRSRARPGPLGDVVDVVGPYIRRQVLPASVAGDRDDHALVDL